MTGDPPSEHQPEPATVVDWIYNHLAGTPLRYSLDAAQERLLLQMFADSAVPAAGGAGSQGIAFARGGRVVYRNAGVTRASRLFGPDKFYGPDGLPGDREYLVEEIAERRVALTEGLYWNGLPACVSTILTPCAWVIDGPREDRPFETIVRVEGADIQEEPPRWRYPTRAEAEAGHAAIVRVLQVVHRHRLRRIRSAYRARRRRR